MKIAVLLSGGVDSSVVVHLLCEQGYKPDLFYIKIGSDSDYELDCPAEEDIELCRMVARRYGLSFEIVDLHRQYWDNVIAYVMRKAAQGRTPNPDVMCNRLIKFGCFEEIYGHRYDRIATGHYATTIETDGRVWLSTAKDPIKDQTDFLAQITYQQLRKLMFPIGHLMKEEVRQLALTAKLPTSTRKDSQGICFLGKISYNDLLRKYLGERQGEIVEKETGRVLSTHNGYWFYTIGQRKGLGMAGGPWFVVGKDTEQNIIYVSNAADLPTEQSSRFFMPDLHFLTMNPGFSASPTEIRFKIRHCETYATGFIRAEREGFMVESPTPIQGIAPGQFGVIYDKEAKICYGSGEIDTFTEA